MPLHLLLFFLGRWTLLFGPFTLCWTLFPLLAVKEKTMDFNKANIPQQNNSWRKFNQAMLFQLLSKFDTDPWMLSLFCYLLRATWGLPANVVATGLASDNLDQTDSLYSYLADYTWLYLSNNWDELVSTYKRQRLFSSNVDRSAKRSQGKHEQGILLW